MRNFSVQTPCDTLRLQAKAIYKFIYDSSVLNYFHSLVKGCYLREACAGRRSRCRRHGSAANPAARRPCRWFARRKDIGRGTPVRKRYRYTGKEKDKRAGYITMVPVTTSAGSGGGRRATPRG